MKNRLILIIFALAVFSMFGVAQSVVITGKKVTYKRPKPINEYKKTFTINYPKVKAATPALSKKIENTISYAKVLGLKLDEELRDIQWLEEADYEVGYNKSRILCITLSMNGTAAYPSGTSKIVVVDLKTGLRVRPLDVFINTSGLLAIVKKAEDKEVADAIIEIKKDPENGDVDAISLFKESAEYQKVSLNEFSVDEKGVTFHHNYDFAHVVQALQPAGEFFFSWVELKPYIKHAGLLTRIAR